ncbi:uncharacterized protein TrAtP1_013215 [Trichoderma atroviride]|uniref:Carbohydrate-binding module family 13 protein n=1 Tax=Hypocrea atroviridis (strain ATCC 20476 / IMI 206040) TaxID=452589 RepID=G9NTR6_HYPAI|nr:carbohydrate-binding module family 13 protein [Trichoderma atroviride IMI 206040]EHK46104.1 carbohydrate-binding module family 13 protein [Trichoderma atroviride IMI 206040]UKZ72273.1 hypothetical protein TrAtP1_013215 [Trichoderma atroviride]
MAPLLDGIYTIANNVQHYPVLDLDGATNPFASPIAGVVGFTNNGPGTKNQQWIVTTLRPGVYSLQSAFAGNTWLAAPTDGATLAQIESSRYDPVYNEVTRWKITNIEGNNYQIESVPFPGKVMDLEMANPTDGTRVILYPNNKTPNQIWTFIPNAIP